MWMLVVFALVLQRARGEVVLVPRTLFNAKAGLGQVYYPQNVKSALDQRELSPSPARVFGLAALGVFGVWQDTRRAQRVVLKAA